MKNISITSILMTVLLASAPCVVSANTSTNIKATEKNEQANIQVVSSIKPIQLITTAIVGNLGKSELLLPPSANPHHYQLRPSQRSIVSKADLFVWVGPDLELFLVKVLKTTSVKQLALIEALNLNSKSHTSASNEESGSHHDHHHSSDEHNGSFDPHIWLNPELTKQIAEVIYQQLTIQYPALKSQFKQNLDDFVSQLSIAEQKIANQFGAQKPLSIYTFHQAFTHFAEHYGLHIEGTITRTPEARPGAKHLSELSKEIQQKSKICLVKEPNFKAPYINSIASETEVVFTTADPLATTIENSPKGYIDFIHSIADSFYQCFE